MTPLRLRAYFPLLRSLIVAVHFVGCASVGKGYGSVNCYGMVKVELGSILVSKLARVRLKSQG